MAHNNDDDDIAPPSDDDASSVSPPRGQAPPPRQTQSQTQREKVTDKKGRELGYQLFGKDGTVIGYYDKGEVAVTTKGVLGNEQTVNVDLIQVRPLHWWGKPFITTYSYMPKGLDYAWHAFKCKADNSAGKDWEPFFPLTKDMEMELAGLYMLAARKENAIGSGEFKDLELRAASNDFGRTGKKARAVAAGVGVVAAASIITANEVWNHSLGKIMEKYFGHETKIPGETVKVPPTDQDIRNASHAKLLKEVFTDLGSLVNATDDLKIFKLYSNATDFSNSALETLHAKNMIIKPMWTNAGYQAALKGMGKTEAGLYSLSMSDIAKLTEQIGFNEGIAEAHGLLYSQMETALKDTKINLSKYAAPTLDNIIALESFAIKDPTADLLWANYATELNASYNITVKDDLYAKTPIELVQLADTIAQEKGGAAWQAVVNMHSTYLATAKAVIDDDAYTDAEIDAEWGNASLDHIVELDQKITQTPEINSVFSDTYLTDYFSHTGLTKKGAYNDKDLQGKVQAGIEYKFFAKQYDKNLTADTLLDLTGDARTNAISSLHYIADQYSWLTGNYNINLTLSTIQEITNNDTYGNTSLGTALAGLWNNGADRAEIYLTKDGLFAQGFANNTMVTSNIAKYGLKCGGAMDNNQINFELFKKFKG